VNKYPYADEETVQGRVNARRVEQCHH